MLVRLLIAIALITTVSSAAVAQPRADKREKLKQKIRITRAIILAEQLELDEATAGKIGPILNRFDDEMAKLLEARSALFTELRDAEAKGDDARMNKAIDKLVANQDARWDTERRRFADLRKLLTARQAARLLDALPEIDRLIMRKLRQHMAPRRAGGAMRRGKALPDDAPENPF